MHPGNRSSLKYNPPFLFVIDSVPSSKGIMTSCEVSSGKRRLLFFVVPNFAGCIFVTPILRILMSRLWRMPGRNCDDICVEF